MQRLWGRDPWKLLKNTSFINHTHFKRSLDNLLALHINAKIALNYTGFQTNQKTLILQSLYRIPWWLSQVKLPKYFTKPAKQNLVLAIAEYLILTLVCRTSLPFESHCFRHFWDVGFLSPLILLKIRHLLVQKSYQKANLIGQNLNFFLFES